MTKTDEQIERSGRDDPESHAGSPALLPRRPFQHLLVTTDFSEGGRHAVAVAASLASRLGAALTVLHVFRVEPMYAASGVYFDPAELRRVAQLALDRAVSGAHGVPSTVSGLLLEGAPAERIAFAAHTRNADLIVMGTHGRTGLSRLVMGSVAEQVVRESVVPVLTVTRSSP